MIYDAKGIDISSHLDYTRGRSDGRMTRKTAISMEETLFKKAEELAREMHVSRSHLISQAIEDFLKKHENLKLLHQINRAYESAPALEEKKLLEHAGRKMEEIAKRDGY